MVRGFAAVLVVVYYPIGLCRRIEDRCKDKIYLARRIYHSSCRKCRNKLGYVHISSALHYDIALRAGGEVPVCGIEHRQIAKRRGKLDKLSDLLDLSRGEIKVGVDVNESRARLLVLKYRASGEANIALEVGTQDNDVEVSWGTKDSVDGDVSLTRLAKDVATEWTVVVVDLSDYGYTKDSDVNVQVRITTASSRIDIAYAAIVDDVAEAEELIDEKVDPTYLYISNWKNDAGEVRSLIKE